MARPSTGLTQQISVKFTEDERKLLEELAKTRPLAELIRTIVRNWLGERPTSEETQSN